MICVVCKGEPGEMPVVFGEEQHVCCAPCADKVEAAAEYMPEDASATAPQCCVDEHCEIAFDHDRDGYNAFALAGAGEEGADVIICHDHREEIRDALAEAQDEQFGDPDDDD